MVLLRAPCSAILSPLQPSIYTHLPHGLAAGIRNRLLEQRGAVHALRADFGDDTTRMRAHHLRTRSAITGDEIRVVKHGFSDSGNGKRETGNVNVSTCPVSRCTFPEFRIC